LVVLEVEIGVGRDLGSAVLKLV
jgi:GTPase SAR1 family protein